MKRTFIVKKTDEQSKRKFWEFMKELPDDGEYTIEVKKNRPIRSLQANKFYWAVMKIYAIETGHTEQEIELMFKMDRHYSEIVYPDGRIEKIPAPTRYSDTKEFSAICNNLLQWGRENFPEAVVQTREMMTYQTWLDINEKYEQVFSGF